MKKDLIFEIGTEEIPARYMAKTLKEFRSIAENIFDENRISYSKIATYGTPRRLTLYAENVPVKQENLEVIKKGPSEKAGYDNLGKPTKALLGFLKGNNLQLNDVFHQEGYIFGKKFIEGDNTIEVLKELLFQIVTSISFPISMKWGNKSFKFVRPIRWFMPIYGDTLIELNKDGIPCDKKTKGHRALSTGDIYIENTDIYFKELESNFVIVDQDQRREMIKRQTSKIASEKGGNIVADDRLLEEILYLVEYPTAFCGYFHKDFLQLPREVVITPMKEHQRYFPLEDKKGNLMNCFIAVRNGNENYIEIVKEGNEKVLHARLSDAKFFFDEDKKIALDDCVLKLKDVVFQETLGTMYDKTNNIRGIARYISNVLSLNEKDKKHLDRAAYLCKGDLVSNMVKEFDELQGIMGGEYAIIQGESPQVASAIKEHYMPRFSNDNVPKSLIGSIISIADKIDTIVGCFSIGIQPTGSQDPYALRRQAIGIINIILIKKINIAMKDLLSKAIEAFTDKGILKNKSTIVISEIEEFIKGRLKNVLLDKGYNYDILDAVLAEGIDDIYDSYLKIQELSEWRKKEEFLDIISSFKRVSNLASKCESVSINPNLAIEKEEKNLINTFNSTKERFYQAMNSKNYKEALESLKKLKNPIDEFFDNIMVMVDDVNLRNNRLSILKSIADMMKVFADLNMIVINK